MRVGLIDFDSKIPNLALMKLSTYYKQQSCKVLLNDFDTVDKVHCSVLFTWNSTEAEKLKEKYPNIVFGGTGWDLKTTEDKSGGFSTNCLRKVAEKESR